jgi:hypothetical protein
LQGSYVTYFSYGLNSQKRSEFSSAASAGGFLVQKFKEVHFINEFLTKVAIIAPVWELCGKELECVKVTHVRVQRKQHGQFLTTALVCIRILFGTFCEKICQYVKNMSIWKTIELMYSIYFAETISILKYALFIFFGFTKIRYLLELELDPIKVS